MVFDDSYHARESVLKITRQFAWADEITESIAGALTGKVVFIKESVHVIVKVLDISHFGEIEVETRNLRTREHEQHSMWSVKEATARDIAKWRLNENRRNKYKEQDCRVASRTLG